MIKLEYDQLKHLAGTQLCAEHLLPVVLVWHSGEKCWTLACGKDHYPDALVRQPSLTEMYRAGELPEGPVADNIRKRERRKNVNQEVKKIDPNMAMIPQVDLATGQLITPEDVKALIAYAEKYGLDPYRGHVVLMYGKPYIGLDGYLYDYTIEDGTHAWIATVKKVDPPVEFQGLGIVTDREMTEKSTRDSSKLRAPVVAAHPWQMAQKRAEWQGLRRAFPVGESPDEKEGNNG